MKKKYWIAGIVVLAAAAAALILLLQNQPAGIRTEVQTAAAETVKAENTAAEEQGLTVQTASPDMPAEETINEAAETNSAEQEKEQPFLVQITENDPATAYVLVRMPNPVGLLPLPTEGEYSRTIRTMQADGTEAVNVLHLKTDGFWMEDANCEGHDCVNQGEVTLANREDRILWNMIICLPHQLSAELITREEAEQMLSR